MSNDFYINWIKPYAGIIVKICRAYTDSQEDFEDYYQEVCLQIWRTRKNFKEQSEWSTWIYRLALNVCLTMLKKHKKAEHFPLSDGLSNLELESNQAFSNDDLNYLYAAIKQLSEIDRGVILLYLEGKTYQEIADITGTNLNNIGVRIKRIKDCLKKLLDGKIY